MLAGPLGLASRRTVCHACGMLQPTAPIGSLPIRGWGFLPGRAGVGLLLAAIVFAAGRPKAAGAPELRYEVAVSGNSENLQVEADIPAGLGSTFTVDPSAARFVERASWYRAGAWVPLTGGRGTWRVAGCEQAGCRVRYLFQLRAAAEAIDDPDTAASRGGALVAPAATWLLRRQPLPKSAVLGGCTSPCPLRSPSSPACLASRASPTPMSWRCSRSSSHRIRPLGASTSRSSRSAELTSSWPSRHRRSPRTARAFASGPRMPRGRLRRTSGVSR